MSDICIGMCGIHWIFYKGEDGGRPCGSGDYLQ